MIVQARIYKPSKTAMQSGKAKSADWVLEFIPEKPRTVEPLMGYTSSSDMQAQVRLKFPTLEEAEAYARREGIAYRVFPEHTAKRRQVAYSDNFRFDRTLPWTH